MLPEHYKAANMDGEIGPNDAGDVKQSKILLSGCFAALFLVAGAIGTLLGSAWIHTFGFTSYRAHYAHIGLPLGVFTLLFSMVFIAIGIAIIQNTFQRADE